MAAVAEIVMSYPHNQRPRPLNVQLAKRFHELNREAWSYERPFIEIDRIRMRRPSIW
jgi:hypothetical protein